LFTVVYLSGCLKKPSPDEKTKRFENFLEKLRVTEHKKAWILREMRIKFSKKLPQKRKNLAVQGDFVKKPNIERTELCFVKV